MTSVQPGQQWRAQPVTIFGNKVFLLFRLSLRPFHFTINVKEKTKRDSKSCTVLIVGLNTDTFAVRLFRYLALMSLFTGTLQLNLLLITRHLNNATYSGSSMIGVIMQRDSKRNS